MLPYETYRKGWVEDAQYWVAQWKADFGPDDTPEDTRQGMLKDLAEYVKRKENWISDLLWDEKIDDKEGDRLKANLKDEEQIHLDAMNEWLSE